MSRPPRNSLETLAWIVVGALGTLAMVAAAGALS